MRTLWCERASAGAQSLRLGTHFRCLLLRNERGSHLSLSGGERSSIESVQKQTPKPRKYPFHMIKIMLRRSQGFSALTKLNSGSKFKLEGQDFLFVMEQLFAGQATFPLISFANSREGLVCFLSSP